MNWAEVLPTLQRFYRASEPTVWLKLSLNLLNAFLAYIPVLQARESLRRVLEFQVGSGSMERRAAQRLVEKWERIAAPDEAKPDEAQITKGEFAARMRMLGFQVNV